MVSRGPLVRLGLQAAPEHRVLLVLLGLLDLLVLPGHKACRAWQAQLELQALRACRELPVQQALRAHQERMEPQAHLAPLAPLGLLAQLGTRGLRGRKGRRVCRELKARRGCPVLKDRWVQRDQTGLPGRRVPLGPLGLKVRGGLRVLLDLLGLVAAAVVAHLRDLELLSTQDLPTPHRVVGTLAAHVLGIPMPGTPTGFCSATLGSMLFARELRNV